MALKSDVRQELLAELSMDIFKWFLGDFKTDLLNIGEKSPEFVLEFIADKPVFYRIIDKENNVIEHWSHENIMGTFLDVSFKACTNGGKYELSLGAQGIFDDRQTKKLFRTICQRLRLDTTGNYDRFKQITISPVSDTPLTGIPPTEYCFKRFPFAYFSGIPFPDTTEEMYNNSPKTMFGNFIYGVWASMRDFNPRTGKSVMFEILMCMVARTVTEDRFSEEMLAWYGKGGDGKGTLFGFIRDQLGPQATMKSADILNNRFGAASYAFLTALIIDEFGKENNLFQDKIKFLTGNDQIDVERKGQDIQTVKNRLKLIFLMNDYPSFDMSNAQRRRLRYIESKPKLNVVKKKIDRDVLRKDLENHWPTFICQCIQTYNFYEKKIPETPEKYLKELAEKRFESADSDIMDNFVYKKGAFVSVSLIKKICPRLSSRSFGERVYIIEPEACEEPIEKAKRRLKTTHSPVAGYSNVCLTSDHYSYSRFLHLFSEGENKGLSVVAKEK
jgi:hypothetical protein